MLSPRRESRLPIASLLLLLSSVAFLYRQTGQLLLPLYAQAMHLLLPESCHLTSLRLIQQGYALCFTVRVETHAPAMMAGHSIPAGIIINGSTLLGHALLPPVIMLSSLCIWLCLFTPRAVMGPSIVLLIFLLLVVSIDVPLVLVGSLHDIVHAHYAVRAPDPWQAKAMHLLNGGGRQVLALAAFFASVSLGGKLQDLFTDHFCRPRSTPAAPTV